MRRFFVPPDQSRGEVFDLPEREARHAIQVLRLKAGDSLTVLDGLGSVLSCTVESVSKRVLRARTCERCQRPPLPCPVTLVQAIAKGHAFEAIIQKATEMGVSRIVPLVSERVVAHVGERDAIPKVEKWRQIAIESIKQCGSPWLPRIEPPVVFDRFSRYCRELEAHNSLTLVCSLEEQERTLKEAMTDYITLNKKRPSGATVWIGPEGDFTQAEYSEIARLGATAVTLGPLVLRADTAAISILTLLNYELGNQRLTATGQPV